MGTTMAMAVFATLFGFISLAWSADRFVNGAAAAAKQWNVSPMLIGLTVVSMGTSAPEILVSIIAASHGHGEIAIGNALGSNIANIGLVLGVTALVAPLTIKKSLVWREIPWLILITLVAGACLLNGYLGPLDSLILIIFLALTLYLMFRWKKKGQGEDLASSNELPELSKKSAWINLAGGLVILLISSQILVWGAVQIAEILGISKLVIGLTIVAIGTSLPELAASVMSALRNHHDMALGNIAGSNIFNLLAVLAVPGLFAQGEISQSIITRDYPVVLGLTLLLAALMLGKQPKILGRLSGILLITCYAFYGTWLYFQST